MELVVTNAFLSYVVGDLITDPAIIAALLPTYADDVVKIGGDAPGGGGPAETLSVLSVTALVGLPVQITGAVSNSNLPLGLSWSINGGATWNTAANFLLSGSSWSCTGPTYLVSGAQAGFLVQDTANPGMIATVHGFTVEAPVGVEAVAGLSGTVSAAALKSALAIGKADVSGLGNAATANFGTVTGSVADGGVLASVEQVAGGLLSAGQVNSIAGLNGTISAASLKTALAITAGDVTGLGNVATSNFGTIAGTVADGGSLSSVAGSLASIVSATAANVTSALSAGHLAGIPWADAAGSAGVFPHGVVPAPPFARGNLLFGDRLKLAANYNFAEVWDTEAYYDAYPKLQAFLLYCQSMALAMKNTEFDSNCYRMCVTAYLPRGTYLVSQPLVVPEYVNLHTDGMIVRTPYTGDQSNNGTTSAPGAFYAATIGAQGQFEPTVIIAPRAHASRLNVYVGNDNIAFRGSGVAIGRTWAAVVGQPCTIGNAGSGYGVNDIIKLEQPSAATYWNWCAQVTAVNATGGITGANVYLSGAYGLPPALQAQQWTAANGFNVFDTANPGCFLQVSAYRSDFKTPSPGTGVTLAPTWGPDFVGGLYAIGAAIQTDTLIGHLNVTGFVPSLYSQTYGGTWGVMITGLNGIIDEIELLGGNDGVYCQFANDWRITTMNCVGSSCALEIYASGSIECPNVVFDTCGAALIINESDRIQIRGLAFYEQANMTESFAYPASLVNSTAQGYSGFSAIQIGQASSASFPNAHLDVSMTLVNMGGLPASTIALYPNDALGSESPRAMPYSMTLSYTFASRFDLRVTNIGEGGGLPTLLPSAGFVCFGQMVDASNEVRGMIDGPTFVTGPAAVLTTGHGWPACSIRIWDAVANGWQGAGGTYELTGSGAPVNGTSGTGAGKAAKGSTYRDLAGPGFYIQAADLSSPSWTQIS